jgi:hypothetical protein
LQVHPFDAEAFALQSIGAALARQANQPDRPFREADNEQASIRRVR